MHYWKSLQIQCDTIFNECLELYETKINFDANGTRFKLKIKNDDDLIAINLKRIDKLLELQKNKEIKSFKLLENQHNGEIQPMNRNLNKNKKSSTKSKRIHRSGRNNRRNNNNSNNNDNEKSGDSDMDNQDKYCNNYLTNMKINVNLEKKKK